MESIKEPNQDILQKQRNVLLPRERCLPKKLPQKNASKILKKLQHRQLTPVVFLCNLAFG